MTVQQVLKELKSMADPRAVEVWRRMGMDPANYYGVNLTKLKEYAKKVGKSHALAAELWATGIHDARLLATMIEEPKKVTEQQIDEWIAAVDFFDLSDKLCANVVAKTPFAAQKMRQWIKSKEELVKRSGFILMGELAKNGDVVAEPEFADYLDLIEQSIHREQNWAKEAMNMALISVGGRSRKLNQKAVTAARKIGQVAVDYGESSCQVPDAVTHLTKERLLAKLK